MRCWVRYLMHCIESFCRSLCFALPYIYCCGDVALYRLSVDVLLLYRLIVVVVLYIDGLCLVDLYRLVVLGMLYIE